VKVWDIRDQSPKTPVSQLDCLVRTFNIYLVLTTLLIVIVIILVVVGLIIITSLIKNIMVSRQAVDTTNGRMSTMERDC